MNRRYSHPILLTLAVVTGLCSARADYVIRPGENWVPVRNDPWIKGGSAIDFSTLRSTEAPAGCRGRVVARDGHFEFTGLPGVAQRFYGINICGNSNTIDAQTAKRFAENLARVGYNAVRLMHLGGLMDQNDRSGLLFDEEAFARLDGLVYECIKNGLYLTFDLCTFKRKVSWRTIGEEREGLAEGPEAELPLVYTHEGYRRNFVEYVRRFLSHVNRRTGRSYAEEPAVIWVGYLNEPYSPKGYDMGKWAQALEGECRFAREMGALLHGVLDSKVLTANMNGLWFPAFLQVPRAEQYDVIDAHYYIEHPDFGDKTWGAPNHLKNENEFRGESRGGASIATHRDPRKPFVVSEWNACGPSKFRMASSVAFPAYAALQDWSGLWRFDWCWDDHGAKWPEVVGVSWFAMCGDCVRLATERAGMALFARKCLNPLRRQACFVLDAANVDLKNHNWGTSMWKGKISALGWEAQIGTVVGSRPPAGMDSLGSVPEAFTNSVAALSQKLAGRMDSCQVEVCRENGSYTIASDGFCAVFAESGAIRSGLLSANISRSPAVIYVMSLTDDPIVRSAHLLVAHLTDLQNEGTRYSDETRSVCLYGGKGKLPQLVRSGKAEVELAIGSGTWRIYPLSTNGSRRTPIEGAFHDGRFCFTADIARDPADAMFQYELVRE